MTWRRTLAVAGPALAALGLSLAFWSRVPDRIPIHWDADGNPDGWAPKTVGLLLLPAVGLLVSLIVSWAVRKGDAPRTADALAAGFGLFHAGLQYLVIQAAIGPAQRLPVGSLMVMMGALFVALGIAMPQLSQNGWAGIRTPWTMRDEVNWRLTHRFAGWTMGIGGGIAALAGLALPVPVCFWVACASVSVGSLLPVGYSYVIHRMRRKV